MLSFAIQHNKQEEGNVRLRSRFGGDTSGTVTPLSCDFKMSQGYKSSWQLPWYSVLIVGILFGVLYICSYFAFIQLPEPITIDEEGAYPKSFITERAYMHLQHLTSFGPKIVGSYENEVLAVDYLKREISFIKQLSHRNISIDIQKVTGHYYLGFQPYGFVNYYANVHNVIAKLHSSTQSSSSLLINCHFDSVPTSPGSSDDGLNCAILLEILRVLSRSSGSLQHNIIFLFNGAEENPLQASHGFITQHEWAKEVKAFINLEACGAGGKEILFQTGPNHPWLVEMYSDSVLHPFGVVIGEEVFQSGLIPSDTDFRIFRDFGHIPGLDMAQFVNGYVYHTKFDNMDAIPNGTFQNTGDNILALAKEITSADKLEDTSLYSSGKSIFFDFLGLFMITYSELAACIVNSITVVVSICTQMATVFSVGKGLTRMQLSSVFLLSVGVPFAGWVISAIYCYLIALLLDAGDATMSWFTNSVYIFTLYYCPIMFFCMLAPMILNQFRNKMKILVCRAQQARLYCSSVQLLWTIILLVATVLQIRSAFLLMILVLFPSLGNLILIVMKRLNSAQIWICVFLTSLVIPILYVLYLTNITYSMFVPLTARMGASNNPEIIIVAFSLLQGLLATSFITPMIVLVRKARYFLLAVALAHIISLVLVMATPIGFPFSSSPIRPQRFILQHVSRTFYDNNVKVEGPSGFWLTPLDRHGVRTLKPYIPEVMLPQNAVSDCENEIVCGLPIYSARIISITDSTVWIPAKSPDIYNPTKLELISHKVTSVKPFNRRMSFKLTGPDHMGIFLSPIEGVNLIRWGFGEIPTKVPMWKKRPVYFIHYGSGMDPPPWEFWFEFEVPASSNSTIVDIGVAGHYMTVPHSNSPEFHRMMEKFPDWAHVTAWTSSFSRWRY